MTFFKKNNTKTATFKVQSVPMMGILNRTYYAFWLILLVFFSARYFLWWINPNHVPNNAGLLFLAMPIGYLLFAVLTLILFLGLAIKLGNFTTILFARKPKHIEPESGLRVAFLTCFVPSNEPISMLRKTLIAMKRVDYPHDTWVLDEGNSEEVRLLCKKLGVLHFSRNGVTNYNDVTGIYKQKTKAGNLNSWRNDFERHYDIVAQLDMDHVPNKNYLTRILGYFKDPSVGYVGIPQIYTNTKSWISRGAAEQTHFFYGPLQQGFYGAHMPSFTGTAHTYRVKAMEQIGGYAPTIAEDYLTGLNFASKKWKGVYVPEPLAGGEGPTTWSDYFNQQFRWSYGLFEILFKHTHRHILKVSLMQKFNLFFSQLFYFTGVATVLGFILTTLYLTTGLYPANVNFSEWVLYSFPPFLVSTYIGVFLHRFYIDPENEPVIGLRGLLLGQAAGIIYSTAFAAFLIGKKVTYKVTGKGVVDYSNDNYRVFYAHIYLLLASLISLVASFTFDNNSLVMRSWAVLLAIMMTIVVSTIYITPIKRFISSIGLTSFAFISKNKDFSYASVASILFIITVTLLLLPQRVENTKNATISPVGTENIVASTTGSQIYLYEAKPGSTLNGLGKQAIRSYILEENLNINENQINYAAYLLIQPKIQTRLQVGDVVSFPRKEVAEAINLSY